METTELLAKILANENLFVRKAKISTAAFDLVNRELILPMWEDLNPMVETMLIEHETGHALFTPLQYREEVTRRPFMSSILNVIEDVRIERLFKERYPGSRKDFAAASKILRETDFFELSGKDLTTLNLIDRINIYSKLGVLSGVKFEQKELIFVQRASRTVTFKEVIELADDIYNFMREELVQQTSLMIDTDLKVSGDADGDAEDGETDEFDEQDGETEDSDGDEGLQSYGNHEQTIQEQFAEQALQEAALQSKTDELLSKKLQEAAGLGATPYYFILDEEYKTNPVIGYKDVLYRLRGYVSSAYSGQSVRDPYDRFKSTVTKQVGHLVQQFELKKAADTYARRRITKTGYIDVNKISQYKIKDDIFKRNIKISEGQNHGMIMLLDWSRSMVSHSTIHHSLDQMMQLVMFCRSVNIPYRVYAFIDPIYEHRAFEFDHSNHLGNCVNLLEFFNNDMTLAEHNEMMSYIASRVVMQKYKLGYTPLAPAILAMRKIIPEFKAKYKVQKLNFITFTDGCNTCKVIYNQSKDGSVYVRDNVLNKNFVVTRDPRSEDVGINEVNAFYSIIKERFDCTVTTFFVTGNLDYNSIRWSGVSSGYNEVLTKLRPDFKKNGFVMLKGYGRDAIYFVNSNILRTAELDLSNIKANMSSSVIARTMKNSTKSSLKNKILIEKFADSIC